MSYDDVVAVRTVAQALELAGVETGWGVFLAEVALLGVASWKVGTWGWRLATAAGRKAEQTLFGAPSEVAREVIAVLGKEEAVYDEKAGHLATDSLTVHLAIGKTEVKTGSGAYVYPDGAILKVLANGVDLLPAMTEKDHPLVKHAVEQALARVRERERLQAQQAALEAIRGKAKV